MKLFWFFLKNFFCFFIEPHNIIDADPLSNSLNEHLASIVKLDAPIIQDGQTPPPNAVETPPAPTENSDLKADASGYYGYGYGSYRPPYYPYYGGGYPYYGAYWPYAGYYSRPSYPSYYPYGHRNNYYSGMTLPNKQ